MKLGVAMGLIFDYATWVEAKDGVSRWKHLRCHSASSTSFCCMVKPRNLSEDNMGERPSLMCSQHVAWARNKPLFVRDLEVNLTVYPSLFLLILHSEVDTYQHILTYFIHPDFFSGWINDYFNLLDQQIFLNILKYCLEHFKSLSSYNSHKSMRQLLFLLRVLQIRKEKHMEMKVKLSPSTHRQ